LNRLKRPELFLEVVAQNFSGHLYH